MTAKLLRVSFVWMIIAAVGCAEEVAEKPTEVQAQTQALVMTPGWIAGSTWPAETMVALNSVHLRKNSQVVGDVAVIRAGSGPFLSGSYEAAVGHSVELRGDLRADSVNVQDGGHVFGSVSSNSLLNRGTIDGAKVSPLALPLAITVPSVPNFSAGSTDVTVSGSSTQTRAAGSYRNVQLRGGSRAKKTVLTLSGGVYALASLDLAEHSRVECSAACELRIKGRLSVDAHAYIGPAATSGLQVSAVKVIVEGTNGGNSPSSTPLAADLGPHSELKAFVFVPNGTLWLRAKSNSVGKFIAKDLDAGNDADVQDGTAVVVLPGEWRSGSRWPSEAITALNSVDFNEGVRVTGDVAVISAAAGPVLSSGYEASLGPHNVVTGSLSADSVIARARSRVTGALAYNNLTDNNVRAGSFVTPLALPLDIVTPAFPAFNAGTTAVDVAGRGERTLAAGSYGLIKLRAGVKSDNTLLKLTGGVYDVADIDLSDNTRIECTAACELRVKNRIAPGSRSYIGPAAGSGLDISQVRIFVEGRNAGNGQPLTTPYAAVFGADSSLSAFVFVPNGTLHVRNGAEVRGRLAARDVLVANGARVDAAGEVITPPQITQQPSSISVVDGQSATFTVVAIGTEISLQWQRNGADIPGATAGSYTLDPAGMSDTGAIFRVVITNAAGSVTSNAATLTVTPAPPVITTQPASVTVLEGEAASFSCSASGTAPSYRWTHDGNLISGATNATYTIPSVRVADGGDYRCIATNAAGSATSDPATLTVTLRPPVITAEPSDLTRTEGQSATFSVTATGTDLSYQWRKGGVPIAGKTSATLSIASVAIGDAGQYDVVVTNGGGSVTSRSATLTVQLIAPKVTQHPASQTVTEGAPVVFTCGASGNLLLYQWLFGGVPIPGANAESYTIIAASQEHAGSYRCVVSNSGGSDTSNAAVLTVRLLPPEITTHPSAVTVTEQQSASFSCEASGTAVSYRWQRNGSDLAGADSNTYTIASVAPADAGNYRCIATNSGGSATSQAAELKVLLLPPVIESGPSSLTVTENQPATFHCTARGSSVEYQWQKGTADIAGATNATYTIAHAKETDEGEYRCVATNSGGTTTSDPATLNVQALPPQITNHPDPKTVDEHGSVSFTCEASGSGVSYRWQKGEDDIADASDATYTIADVLHTDAGAYRCIATNESGSATSNAATLTVRLLAPEITTHPTAVTATERDSASFSCEARGTLVSYRWQRNGSDIPGANSQSYTIASVTPDDAGNYRCVATNSGGSAASQVAALSVNLLPPVIESGPSSLTVTENQPATFHCTARGSSLGYTWQKGSDLIAGATDATYTIAHAKETDEGEYRCVVTNSGGSVTSEPATLSVQALPPQITNQPDSKTVDEHDSVSFTCAASGSGVSYRWQKGETDIADASGATYTIADVLHTDAGEYRCVATNESGSATSNAATLTVRLLPPQITSHPAAVTVTEKQSASFSCAASGTSVSYRWQRNSVNIAGANSQTYTIASVTPEDAGSYRCVATNSGGSATSQGAVLSVLLLPPAIESGPSSQTVTESEPATFSCTARGSSISYRWLKGTAVISGATAAVFTIPQAKESDEADYFCEVTNSAGSVVSGPATLSVRALPPQITNQPDAKTVDEHDSVSFTCTASGSGVTYHWQKDGTDIAGSSGATYTIADVKDTDAGGYACVATNESGSATSDAATLTVRLLAPQIIAHPENLTVTEDSAATFHCEASGTAVSYRWQKGGVDIPDSAASTFTIASVRLEDAGSYRCIASNTGGSATSQAATLTVNLLPPRISAGPLSVRVYERETAIFQCLGEGTQISYQWQKGEIDLPGATAAELAIVGVAESDAGEYRCKVSNSGGEAFSQPATLTVDLLPPSFPEQPASVTVTEGEPFSLSCPALGTSIALQWSKDGTPIEGAVFAVYSVEAAAVEQTGMYTCTATNSGGSTTSQPASVVVRAKPPVITTQPADVHVNVNQPITLSVVAQGHSLSYQWLRAGSPVPGATQSSYTKAQAAPADDGAVFRVVVTNSGGSVTSDPATVHVADTSAPTLEINGEDEITVSGDTFTVTGSASDAGSGLREVTLISDRVPEQTFGVVLDSAGAFTGDVPLSLGTNVITIVARDAQNNETRRTITVIVTAPELPQITIQAPVAGSTVQTERITVSGRVRSSQPASDIKLLLGSATLYPSGDGPDYAFSFEQVRLVPGPNLITVLAQTPRGNTQADVSVSYGAITPPPPTPIPPVIELQPNLVDMYLSSDIIPVAGTVRAQRCVQGIRVNGAEVSFLGTGPTVTFSTTRSFIQAGSTDVVVSVSATDCDAQTASVSFTAHRDDGKPVITVDGLQTGSTINTVSHSPYRLSGSVTDLALAGVSIANQSVAAQPTGVPGQWRFAVDLELLRQLALPVVIEAWDAAGERSSVQVVLQLDSTLSVEVLAPIERSTYLVTGQAVPIEITARAIGMAAGDVVRARFDDGAEFDLLRAGPVANGVLNVNPPAGEHAITVFVKSSEGSVLAQRSVGIVFKDERDVPVRVQSQEPAPDSTNVEANTPIVVHFNQPIDPSKLTMSVLETVHGKLFEEQPPGADLTQLSAVNLIDVDRDREPVTGVAQNLPGNRMITFYPSRDYGYGGTVFVDLKYDGQDLAHSKFTVRPLPTLVHGFVATQQLIPLQGIEVLLPELGRTATSNDDGNWNFGFGEPPERRITPGRYRAIFNPQRKNDRFGSVERFLEITPGLAFGGTVLVPELNRAEPFRRIASLQPQAASLASGGLQLDLSQASLVFPNGLAEGDVHVQFLVGSEVGHVSIDGARPDWVFGVQPGGVQVQGPVGIRMQVPKLDQSFEYVDRLPEYMLLVGLDPKSLQIAPAGVVRLDRAARAVQSVGAVRLERLDYVGVAITAAEPELLQQYANGEIDLAALTAAIGAAP